MPRDMSVIKDHLLEFGVESRLRLNTMVRIRWFAIIGQLLAVGLIGFVYDFPVPTGPCLLLIAISAWLNVYLRVRFDARHRLSNRLTVLLLGYDLLQLAALLFMTGGIENPFAMLMVAPVTVSASCLPGRYTMLLGTVAVGVAIILTFWYWPLPWLGEPQPYFPDMYRYGVMVAIVSCTIFLSIYAWRLSHEARQMSGALTATELVLAHEQRLHALDGLAAAAAHELGTPLGTIALVSKELMNEVPHDSALRDDLELLRSQALRCREILQKLTQQPTGRDPMHATMLLRQILEEAAEPHRATNKKIQITCAPSDGQENIAQPQVERHPGLIYGLGNLIENAVDFAHSRVDIAAAWSDHHVSVVVRDDGPGFSQDVIANIGDPYVTSRRTRRVNQKDRAGAGLGLGFFIAKMLLERSGATMEFENQQTPASGAIVRILWPRDTLSVDDQNSS